jgi:hypothetical protein
VRRDDPEGGEGVAYMQPMMIPMENRHFITKDYPKEIDFPVSDMWARHYRDYFNYHGAMPKQVRLCSVKDIKPREIYKTKSESATTAGLSHGY